MRIKGIARAALIGLLLAGTQAACGGPSGPDVRADDVWSRPVKAVGETETDEGGMAGTGAVFLLLVNEGGEADRLVGGKTDVAKVVEIHESVMEGEVMKMRMLPDGLQVPAKGEVLLEPGGYHVMLIGMKQDLKVGDQFSVELQFEKSGTITVEPEVREQ